MAGLLGFLVATFGEVGGCPLFELATDTVCARRTGCEFGDGVRGKIVGLGGLLGFLLSSPIVGPEVGNASSFRF